MGNNSGRREPTVPGRGDNNNPKGSPGPGDTGEMERAFREYWPRPPVQRKESVDEVRAALLSEHRRLAEEGGLTEAPPTGHRLFRPIHIAIAGAAGVCAGLIIFFLLFLGGEAPRPSVAELQILRGRVTVITEAGEELAGEDGMALGEGYLVSTERDSIGVVTVEDGSIVRMDASSELAIERVEDDRIGLAQSGSNIYYRVSPGTECRVSRGAVTAEGDSATLNVDTEQESVRTRVFSGTVEIGQEGAPSTSAARGEEALADARGGRDKIVVRLYGPEVLEDPWIRWNLLQDGLLEEKELDEAPEDADIPLPPPVSERQSTGETAPEGTEPGHEEPAPGDTPSDGTPPETPVEPPPGPEPGPEPAPQPQPAPDNGETPVPEEQPEVGINTSVYGRNIVINWAVSGGTFDTTCILRSQENQDPGYPGDAFKTIDNNATDQYVDPQVTEGATYRYRIALLRGGAIVAYSETSTITMPPMSVILTAQQANESVQLDWDVIGQGEIDYFILVRTEVTNTGNRKTWTRPAASRSFADSTAQPGTAYYYRIHIISGGQRVSSSEHLTVQVP